MWDTYPVSPVPISQGETLDDLNRNLKEVIAMLLKDSAPYFDTDFVGIQ